jgi:hypothetical protein
MRNLYELDRFRITDKAALELYNGWAGDDTAGAFLVPSLIDQAPVMVIATNGEGWDHVSVLRRKRCPNWQEMEQVASLFFKDDEVAMQLHVPVTDHINNHPYCLHWWRPHLEAIPRPPGIFVGIKDVDIAGMTTAERKALLQKVTHA